MLAFIVLTIVCGLIYLLLTAGIGIKMFVNSISLTPNTLSIDIGNLKTIKEKKVNKKEEKS
jgi:multisubunit Na+/H+ antiporter MnhE subunit